VSVTPAYNVSLGLVEDDAGVFTLVFETGGDFFEDGGVAEEGAFFNNGAEVFALSIAEGGRFEADAGRFKLSLDTEGDLAVLYCFLPGAPLAKPLATPPLSRDFLETPFDKDLLAPPHKECVVESRSDFLGLSIRLFLLVPLVTDNVIMFFLLLGRIPASFL